jgi:hypothetical protein
MTRFDSDGLIHEITVPAVPDFDLSSEAAEVLISLDVMGMSPSPEQMAVLRNRGLVTWDGTPTPEAWIIVDRLLKEIYSDLARGEKKQ